MEHRHRADSAQGRVQTLGSNLFEEDTLHPTVLSQSTTSSLFALVRSKYKLCTCMSILAAKIGICIMIGRLTQKKRFPIVLTAFLIPIIGIFSSIGMPHAHALAISGDTSGGLYAVGRLCSPSGVLEGQNGRHLRCFLSLVFSGRTVPSKLMYKLKSACTQAH